MYSNTFIKLYKTVVRSHMVVRVWSPHHKILIEDIEKVQIRATQMVQSCKIMSYAERLQFLLLPMLVYRRIRRYMIEVFKILSGKCDEQVTPSFKMSQNMIDGNNSSPKELLVLETVCR